MILKIDCLIGLFLCLFYIGHEVIVRVKYYLLQREYMKRWETWGDDTNLRNAA